jgi:hypothetical protein
VKPKSELINLYVFPPLTIVKQSILVLTIAYLLMCLYFGSRWLLFARRNLNSTPENIFLAFIVLLLVTIFSPLTIPFSCYQIIKKRKKNQS